jgi:hypothetical protein
VKWGHLKELDLMRVAELMVLAYSKGVDEREDAAPRIEVVH